MKPATLGQEENKASEAQPEPLDRGARGAEPNFLDEDLVFEHDCDQDYTDYSIYTCSLIDKLLSYDSSICSLVAPLPGAHRQSNPTGFRVCMF